MPSVLEIHQERIVYAGLSRMTDDRNVIKTAFEFWQHKLSQRTFNIQEIVAVFEKHIGFKGSEKKSLFIAMQAASNRLCDDLLPVPNYLNPIGGGALGAELLAPTNDGASKSAQWQVTNQVIQQYSQYLKKHSATEFSEFKDILVDEGLATLTPSLSRLVQSWASNGLADLQLPTDISVDDCQHTFHAIYLLSTEVIGPIVADQILNKVISNALNLDAAGQFDPRKLV